MPREQLRALAADLDRLIAAGAGAVAGDEGLRRRESALRELGKKVPALGKLAELVGQALAADARRALGALLDLLLVVNQARAGLATAGVAGAIEPAGTSGPWATPCPAHDVYPLAAALGRTGPGRTEVVRDAVARGAFGDLRLVDGFLGALDDSSAELADLVATRILPALGRAVLPDLGAGLDIQGNAADGRRLEAIAAIDRDEGLAQCRRAIDEGNAAVKARALELLAQLDPAGAESTALGLLAPLGPPGSAAPEASPARGKKAAPRGKLDKKVRDAAVACLATSTRDEALEILVAALLEDDDREHYGHRSSHTYLPRLPHPRATGRLLEEMERIASSSRAVLRGKGKAEDRKTEAARIEWRAGCLLEILGNRGDLAAVQALIGLLGHPSADLRSGAATALAKLGDPAGVEAAARLVDDPDAWYGGIEAAWLLPPGPRFEHLAPLCVPVSTRDKQARGRRDSVLDKFESEAKSDRCRPDWDPRWADVLRPHLDGSEPFKAARALAVVLGAGAIPDLLRLLTSPRFASFHMLGAITIFETLGRLRAREAVGPLVEKYQEGSSFRHYIANALREIGDPAAIPLLEEQLKKLRQPWEQTMTQTLIDELRATIASP